MEARSPFEKPIVVASNRGPVSYDIGAGGHLELVRAGGGLVSSLSPVLHGTEALWVATAISAGDRRAATEGVQHAAGFHLRHVDLDEETYRLYYDVIANGTLWFLHHNLFDQNHAPVFDDEWRRAWEAYRQANAAFAQKIAEVAPRNATVLIHDYHLTLTGQWLKDNRPDLQTAHFHHTPFADPEAIAMLPSDARHELLTGLSGHGACGFHAEPWAANFRAACAEFLGSEPRTFVSPAVPDLGDVREMATSDDCRRARTHLDRLRAGGERRLIVRVDRIEPSKNLVRGFQAYDDLLRRYPQWRERSVFAAFTYPTRVNLPEYATYRQQVVAEVARINDQWRTPDWEPIELRMKDDFPTSVAAYLEYDVLLVNPLRDGLNLVAKEGAAVNERDGALVLSSEAGAWHEMSEGAIECDPYSVRQTADALAAALALDDEQRGTRAKAMRDAVSRRSPHEWFGDQMAAAHSD